jgi:hypothetical protein
MSSSKKPTKQSHEGIVDVLLGAVVRQCPRFNAIAESAHHEGAEQLKATSYGQDGVLEKMFPVL